MATLDELEKRVIKVEEGIEKLEKDGASMDTSNDKNFASDRKRIDALEKEVEKLKKASK